MIVRRLAATAALLCACSGTPGSSDGGGNAPDATVDSRTDVALDSDSGRTADPDDVGSDAAVPGDGADASVDLGADTAPDMGAPDMPLDDSAVSSTFPLADPDTVLANDGKYITYGTTIGAGSGRRCGGVGKLYVPFLEHGAGSAVSISNCAKGDAMPDGPGAWAEPGTAIWAPGVAKFGDRFFLFYTASRLGSGQKCIGRATSTSARGPFVDRGEWACPGDGRWVIDANPFVAGGQLYVAYRDDAITTLPETGLSVVRTDDEGRAVWSTRRDLLKSTDITWDTIRINGTTHVIENPSMFRSDGEWYVAYSGNNWDSVRYATGIASCGTSPLPASRCTPLRRGVERPYLGFSGAGDLDPYRELPENHTGSGGLDVFEAADGTQRAVWHWWRASDGARFPMTGKFLRDADGFYAD